MSRNRQKWSRFKFRFMQHFELICPHRYNWYTRCDLTIWNIQILNFKTLDNSLQFEHTVKHPGSCDKFQISLQKHAEKNSNRNPIGDWHFRLAFSLRLVTWLWEFKNTKKKQNANMPKVHTGPSLNYFSHLTNHRMKPCTHNSATKLNSSFVQSC